jgi:hypothetical protein
VLLDAAVGEVQLVGDGDVGAALGERGKDLAFAGLQSRDPLVDGRGRKQLADDLGVQRRAPTGNTAQGVDEVGGADDAVFEHVPHAVRMVGEQAAGVAGLDPLGEDQDGGARVRLADGQRRSQPMA